MKNIERKSISIDELLLEQERTTFLATLEAVKDKPSMVKVIPYDPQGGCGCSQSFNISKESITQVVATGEFHNCCGKRLKVVELTFADKASVRIEDLINRRSDREHSSHVDHRHFSMPPQTAVMASQMSTHINSPFPEVYSPQDGIPCGWGYCAPYSCCCGSPGRCVSNPGNQMSCFNLCRRVGLA